MGASSRLPVLACLASAAVACGQSVPLTVDYPKPFVLAQRDATGQGAIPVRVRRADVGGAGAIEARWRGGAWQTLSRAADAGVFAGTIAASVGQGAVEVRDPARPQEVLTVEPVLVGDLFVIAGQSNADGRGSETVRLSASSPCLGVKYRAGTWSRGDDPSDNEGKHGSPWPIVLNDLIPEQRVPMGFIQAAVGSTVVRQWRRGGDMFARMEKMVREASGGGLRVKAVLYYQGENDITHYNTLSVLGDYEQYRTHLRAMVDDMAGLFQAPVLVGQITNLLDLPERNNSVRRAQQEIWDECPQTALPGAVAYDIFPTDGVHYRDARNLAAFAGRWTYAVRQAFYAPTPAPRPRLLAVRRAAPATLVLTYDRPLAVAAWTGVTASRACGFRLRNGDIALTDADVSATELAGGRVTVTFTRPLPEPATFWYGYGSDGQGKAVLRDAATGIPVPLVFGASVDGAADNR